MSVESPEPRRRPDGDERDSEEDAPGLVEPQLAAHEERRARAEERAEADVMRRPVAERHLHATWARRREREEDGHGDEWHEVVGVGEVVEPVGERAARAVSLDDPADGVARRLGARRADAAGEEDPFGRRRADVERAA